MAEKLTVMATPPVSKGAPLCLRDFADEAQLVRLLMLGQLNQVFLDLLVPRSVLNGDRNIWKAVALEKAPMFRASAQKLLDAGYAADTAASAYWIPGRIEVVGKVCPTDCELARAEPLSSPVSTPTTQVGEVSSAP